MRVERLKLLKVIFKFLVCIVVEMVVSFIEVRDVVERIIGGEMVSLVLDRSLK